MVYFPFCKINLGLHILSKRSDGFHDIETCFYPVPWTDILEILPAAEFKFTTSGIPIGGDKKDNLCYKAWQLLQQEFKIPSVEFYLHKVIPMGAGLGGGSSDAAFTLRALNNFFSLAISAEKLLDYASRLGSDCAFFLGDAPAIGTGKGDKLALIDVSLKGKYLMIIKPPIHVSTAAAYSSIQPHIADQRLSSILNKPINQWKNYLVNDFEPSVFKKYPAIAEIKEQLYSLGAVYASMSGSGSAVFGIFDKPIVIPAEYSGVDNFLCLCV